MKLNKKFSREFLKVSRWLHIYCSTALFALLVFFSITGITLNHRWYDSGGNQEAIVEESLDAQHLHLWGLGEDDLWQPDVNALRDYLLNHHDLKNPSSIELDSDIGEVILEYLVPAGFATAIVSRDEASLIVETETGSLLGIANDLHKGRHSGGVWMWVIDVSAALIVFFSLTGMIILFQGKKHRIEGLISAFLGVITPVIIYICWVPQVGH